MTLRLLLVLALLASCGPGSKHDVPDDVPDKDVNAAPLANAGNGGTALAGATVMLDGSASLDPDGSIVSYRWVVTDRPAGSAAVVTGATSQAATFKLDEPGSFTFTLTVSDDDGASSTSDVTYVARAPALTANAGPDQSVAWKSVVQLSGTLDSEVAATTSWTVLAKPAGSQASLIDHESLTPTFVADKEGSYTVRLMATTDFGSDTDDVTIDVVVARQLLDYLLVDAEYSTALDRFVILSDLPARLRLHDPGSGTEQTMDLPTSPVAVALSADGLRAAVAYTTTFAIVDLQTRTITSTHTVPLAIYDLVLESTRVHTFHRSQSNSGPVHTVNLGNGNVAESAWVVSGFSDARLHPSGSAVYTASTSVSPTDIARWEVEADVLTQQRDSPYHGNYDMGGGVWFKSDGTSLITRAGTVFRASTDSVLDMTYLGTLGNSTYNWVAHSAAAARFAALRVEFNAWYSPIAYHFQLHDEQYSMVRDEVLPDTPHNGSVYLSAGRFVAFNAASTQIYVIARAGTAPGVVHALYSYTP